MVLDENALSLDDAADLRRNTSMFRVSPQLLLDMLCIVPFLSCSENFHYLVHRTNYCDSQDEF